MGSSPTTGGMAPLKMPRPENSGRFQPGWSGGPGRPKGSLGRAKADLSQLIMTAAVQTGFVRKNAETGLPEGTGEDGCLGYLKWAALYEPRTY
jgi:hypothetical protein